MRTARLSVDGHAARYRSEMLERLFTSESVLEAVVYVWVPSHVGITPNELADALAEMAEEWGYAEPGVCGAEWQLARFQDQEPGRPWRATQECVA